MPTAKPEGYSKEVYLVDAVPAGAAEIGRVQRNRDADAAVTLLASAARTADGAGSDVSDAALEIASGLILALDVTAQSGTGPTLDVAVLAKIGASYVILGRFSRTSAATGEKGIVVSRDLAFATELAPAADPAVSTGLLVNNHHWMSTLKVKYAIAGTTPSFTFSVVAYPVR